MVLESINNPNALKGMTAPMLEQLAAEMRSALMSKVSACGGHLGSNLGVVELTIAIHSVFDAPRDKIVFDVSHQTYCHKMLTGRKSAFLCFPQYHEVTGFSNPDESLYDLFHIGHTSTSISLACGLAKGRDMAGGSENVIAVIGDGSLDGGEAYEGLNSAVELGSGIIVIVNDNDMSIPENHGGIAKHLAKLRASKGLLKDNFFKALGFEYHYIDEGNSIDELIKTLSLVKDTVKAVLVHVNTLKGKGYRFAEDDKEKWHWTGPFDIETGQQVRRVPAENYGSIVADYLLQKMEKEPKLVVIAASTPICIGFGREEREKAGKQYIDVGIAEQHAITMAAGIVKRGGKAIFATNSTFIQRCYDQIEQEVSINELPVVMIVTHGSIYGHPNRTHAGIYDMALLGSIPNLTYLAPTTKEEYLSMLEWALEQRKSPVAIRVPWTGVKHSGNRMVPTEFGQARYETVQRGSDVAVLALGGLFEMGRKVVEGLLEKGGIAASLINPIFVNKLDEYTLTGLVKNHRIVVTLEDGVLKGGFGSEISRFYANSMMKVLCYGFSEDLPISFDPNKIMAENGLNENSIVEDVIQLC